MPLVEIKEIAVDFIERLFGVAPDGGDGSLEVLWIGAIVVVGLAFVFRRRIIAALSRRISPR
jgi:hypothetical protein